MTQPILRRTFLLTLPDGKQVRCWQKDVLKIRQDIQTHGDVYLVSDPLTGIYDRVPPDSVEGRMMAGGAARRVDGRDSTPPPS